MADISKINGVAVANIAKINGRTKVAGDNILGIFFPAVGGGGTFVTLNSFQGVLGKVEEIVDIAGGVTLTANSFQGVLGNTTFMRDTTA